MGTRTRYRRKARVKQRKHLASGIDWTVVGQLKNGEQRSWSLTASAAKVMPSIRTYASRVAAKRGWKLSVHGASATVSITRTK